jgi:heavy metal sensor kinase
VIKNAELDLHLATNLTVAFEILHRFRLLLLLSSPIVLLCASAAGYLVSKRAMDPVSQLTTAARSISPSSLNRRLAVPHSGDELQDLAETLNGMLDRMEEAFRRMTQFTANASHELRAPLALMRTTCEVALLRVHGNADTYREALERILREAEKNTDLLDDMLSLARADSTSRALALGPIDLAPNIEQVCERLAPLARERNLDLTYEDLNRRTSPPCAGSAWVSAEPGHLRRLWLILLDNAIKFTPPGGSIRVVCRTAPPDSLICEVRDSGIGIASSDLPHIFERFFRADKARSRDESGAGLGLSLARWIVEAHHGKIEVESVLGAGSVFRVILPAFSGAQSDIAAAGGGVGRSELYSGAQGDADRSVGGAAVRVEELASRSKH